MTIFDALRQRFGRRIDNQTNLSTVTRDSASWGDLVMVANGLPALTEETASTVSAVTACVNLIAGAIASLPLNVYARSRTGQREKLFDDSIWWVLNEQFTPRWSAAAGWKFLVSAQLLHGDGFARILRNGDGSPTGIEPIHPDRVQVIPSADGARLVYSIAPDPRVPAPRGAQRNRMVLDQDDVLHISGDGFDGVRSKSPLQHALRMSGSVALATQDFSARFFANGARPDYALTTEKNLSPEAIADLRAKIDERHGGTANAHRPMLLHSGLDVKSLQLPLEDLQLIATRRFQIEEIARAYGVPPFMIGHVEKTTSWGSGVEAMGTGFVRFTLAQHLTKIHNEFNRKLFRTYAKVIEFDTFELERADMRTMFEAFRIAIGRAGEPGFLSVDEVRAYLNYAPVPGGSDLNKGLANEPAVQPPAA